MARAKVVHSTDGVCVVFDGDKRNPEPSMGVIQFPGGHVEVSRCSDGSYFAHIEVVDAANVVASRLDFQDAAEHNIKSVTEVPNGNLVKKIAIRISNTVPRIDG